MRTLGIYSRIKEKNLANFARESEDVGRELARDLREQLVLLLQIEP